ncbi:uncharacterized protein LOC110942627 [Helianthus annuus]|uniref:uncharacterized protein LOC110942627 n=1 Tax=Helianthus annuus TaxID=4232 RepID=UPI000B8FC870|nr:uncharacterized protein LOC110942627 [Helianthus annuus]
MSLALRVKNKTGFIVGTFTKPVDNLVLQTQWERYNSVVLTWILNSISEELYLGHVYSKSAAEVWKELRDTYDKIDGSVFLMGLDNVYQAVRTNLLIREPLPSLQEAFSNVSRVESHRNSNLSLSNDRSVGLFAKTNSVVDNKKKFVKNPN